MTISLDRVCCSSLFMAFPVATEKKKEKGTAKLVWSILICCSSFSSVSQNILFTFLSESFQTLALRLEKQLCLCLFILLDFRTISTMVCCTVLVFFLFGCPFELRKMYITRRNSGTIHPFGGKYPQI